ncbi:MAG: hypothetical protein ACK559_29030, partial [bacterium]
KGDGEPQGRGFRRGTALLGSFSPSAAKRRTRHPHFGRRRVAVVVSWGPSPGQLASARGCALS